MSDSDSGLSPPTRGILDEGLAVSPRARSIPAYAGILKLPCGFLVLLRSIPRLRGGSGDLRMSDSDSWGLSPPTRGIHRI